METGPNSSVQRHFSAFLKFVELILIMFKFCFSLSGWISFFSTWRRPVSGSVARTSTRRGFAPTPRWSSSSPSSANTASPRTPTPPPHRPAWARRTRRERQKPPDPVFSVKKHEKFWLHWFWQTATFLKKVWSDQTL